jgi:hypothetical protein
VKVNGLVGEFVDFGLGGEANLGFGGEPNFSRNF